MSPFQTTLRIEPGGPGMVEITDRVAKVAAKARGPTLLTLFVRHTSCALLVQENADPSVQRDLQAWLARLAPPGDDPSMGWLTHTGEGPDDMPAHLRAAVLPVSLQIPVEDGKLALGTWQGIYLVEFRTGPRPREVVCHLA